MGTNGMSKTTHKQYKENSNIKDSNNEHIQQNDEYKEHSLSAICFSGSFDPPHRAHQSVLVYLRNRYPRIPIYVLPIASNPYKQTPLLSLNLRTRMVTLMTRGISRCWTDSRIARSLLKKDNQALYIYYYISTLIKKYGLTPPIGFVIGSDLQQEVERWHRYKEFAQLVHFIVFDRGHGADMAFSQDLHYYSSTATRFFLKAGFTIVTELSHILPTYSKTYSKKSVSSQSYNQSCQLKKQRKKYRFFYLYQQVQTTSVDSSFAHLYHRVEYNAKPYTRIAKQWLSHRRFTHSLRVARLSVYITHLLHLRGLILSTKAIYVAAILHDIAREWSSARLLDYSNYYLISYCESNPLFKKKPVLLHGPCAAHMLSQTLGLSSIITDAIAHHTLGAPHMNLFSIVLKLADAIEPKRGRHVLEIVSHIARYLHADSGLHSDTPSLQESDVLSFFKEMLANLAHRYKNPLS